MIECIDVIKIYTDRKSSTQVPALRGCDLLVNDGELISIIGPSGSGKTTLINILSGLESISSGFVRVNNFTVSNMVKEKLNDYRMRVISIVDQFPERTLFLNATVKENIDFAYSLKHGFSITTGEFKQKVLVDLGIDHLTDRIVKTLSGGEMTRLAIACAIVRRCPIMLCDEPTGQLDTENTNRVKRKFWEIVEKYKTTIIVVTHDLRFINDVDKTYEIIDGRISSVLSKEERKRKQEFPLTISSYIDSTKSTRIPELIYDSLKLDKKIDYQITKDGVIKLLNPSGYQPEEIQIKPKKTAIQILDIKPLPKNYSSDKELIVQLSAVNKTYIQNKLEIPALDVTDLNIYKNELVFILGPSGSGKTTLLKVITGLEPCTSGTITVLDERIDLLDDNQRADFRMKSFGILSQQGNMHSYLSIEDNLSIKDIYKTSQTKVSKKDKKELLNNFNIIHKRKAFPLDLSGGELQRASLAMANYHHPPILVLDEPTANLDSELAKKTIDQLKQLCIDRGITIIIATHDFSLIEDNFRVIELEDGKIKRNGLAKIV